MKSWMLLVLAALGGAVIAGLVIRGFYVGRIADLKVSAADLRTAAADSRLEFNEKLAKLQGDLDEAQRLRDAERAKASTDLRSAIAHTRGLCSATGSGAIQLPVANGPVDDHGATQRRSEGADQILIGLAARYAERADTYADALKSCRDAHVARSKASR